jgi:AraC family transcriptional regulator
MNNPCNLLEGILAFIENKIKEKINIDSIACNHGISPRHLQRRFKLAFNQPLGLYIRSRKLAASIDDLLNTNFNVLDIALDYGFEYEQSYIRSFKREYGITPGDFRRIGDILKITPPLNLFSSQQYSEGILNENVRKYSLLTELIHDHLYMKKRRSL